MAVPNNFSDLSTTPGSNSGLISDSTAVNQIDNHLQTVYALIASIYANSGNGWSSSYLPAANHRTPARLRVALVSLIWAVDSSTRTPAGMLGLALLRCNV